MIRILIVDDEPALLKVLKLNVELEGYEASLASDGETAIRRIQSDQPDLVLLDIMMPLLDGWELLQKLRGLDLRKPPKVMVMTAKGAEDRAKGLRLGAHEYMTKPFDTEDLMERVKHLAETPWDELEEQRRKKLEEIEA